MWTRMWAEWAEVAATVVLWTARILSWRTSLRILERPRRLERRRERRLRPWCLSRQTPGHSLPRTRAASAARSPKGRNPSPSPSEAAGHPNSKAQAARHTRRSHHGTLRCHHTRRRRRRAHNHDRGSQHPRCRPNPGSNGRGESASLLISSRQSTAVWPTRRRK